MVCAYVSSSSFNAGRNRRTGREWDNQFFFFPFINLFFFFLLSSFFFSFFFLFSIFFVGIGQGDGHLCHSVVTLSLYVTTPQSFDVVTPSLLRYVHLPPLYPLPPNNVQLCLTLSQPPSPCTSHLTLTPAHHHHHPSIHPSPPPPLPPTTSTSTTHTDLWNQLINLHSISALIVTLQSLQVSLPTTHQSS